MFHKIKNLLQGTIILIGELNRLSRETTPWSEVIDSFEEDVLLRWGQISGQEVIAPFDWKAVWELLWVERLLDKGRNPRYVGSSSKSSGGLKLPFPWRGELAQCVKFNPRGGFEFSLKLAHFSTETWARFYDLGGKFKAQDWGSFYQLKMLEEEPMRTELPPHKDVAEVAFEQWEEEEAWSYMRICSSISEEAMDYYYAHLGVFIVSWASLVTLMNIHMDIQKGLDPQIKEPTEMWVQTIKMSPTPWVHLKYSTSSDWLGIAADLLEEIKRVPPEKAAWKLNWRGVGKDHFPHIDRAGLISYGEAQISNPEGYKVYLTLCHRARRPKQRIKKPKGWRELHPGERLQRMLELAEEL